MRPTRRDVPALALAALLLVAGTSHFLVPDTYDRIVLGWLPFTARLWTITSGVAELALALVLVPRGTRRAAALAVAVLFVIVFPANVKMAIDWADRPAGEFALALLRLPLQIPLVWWAWRVHVRTGAEIS